MTTNKILYTFHIYCEIRMDAGVQDNSAYVGTIKLLASRPNADEATEFNAYLQKALQADSVMAEKVMILKQLTAIPAFTIVYEPADILIEGGILTSFIAILKN